jgi:CRP-like cAMP-binding protein
LREHRPALEGVLRLLCGRLRQKPYRGLCEEPLLAGRGSADRAALEAAGIVAELAPGETLFEAGELTTVLHLVLEGEVEWGSETRGGGAAMDETAFLSDQPAADSCRTRGPVKLLMLEKPALLAVMAGSPETLEGCFAVLVERLKRSNAL